MIVEYHRPESIEAALALLARNDPETVPLGGGTILSRRAKPEFAVVDLQKLGLNQVERQGEMLQIGSTVTLQDLVESDDILPELAAAAKREASYNLRQAATVGGTVAARDGKSPLLSVLLAMDADLIWMPGERLVGLGDWLAARSDWRHGMIVQVRVPVNVEVGYEQVGRSPADQPIISVAVARWASGRTRVVLGGDLPLPILAADGTGGDGIEETSLNAYSHYRNQKYSHTYIQETTRALMRRLLG
jgi:probable selenate reductase FAD-binding subunit